ncbi:hypothetical protein F2Q69_00059839 [Brassica cretica]|uniref:Uncharacterized protein n=1 Tax=Brassica cretica TaxID=69181 RepID=A0A8S9REE7_BRACR|nr:hypothetical protein F2Q69_00059839 [Brassica cretica]
MFDNMKNVEGAVSVRDKRGEIESADTMDETEKKDLEGGYETEYEEGILCFNRVWIFCSVYTQNMIIFLHNTTHVQESNTQNITNKYIKLIAYISLNTRYQTT